MNTDSGNQLKVFTITPESVFTFNQNRCSRCARITVHVRPEYALDPDRAPIIAEMFELYATGKWSLSDLARHAMGANKVSVQAPKVRFFDRPCYIFPNRIYFPLVCLTEISAKFFFKYRTPAIVFIKYLFGPP